MIIAIVGPDGSGKTTQAEMLTTRLNSQGTKAIYIRPVFLLMKKIFRREKSFQIASPRQKQIEMMRRKTIHLFLKELIMLPLGYAYAFFSLAYIKLFLDRGRIIVCDRYFYQYFFDLCGAFALTVSKFFPSPDMIFSLRADFNNVRLRQSDSDRKIPEKYFFALLDFFDRLSKRKHFLQVDAALDKIFINNIIFDRVLKSKK